VDRPQGIIAKQCLHLHAIVGTAWVITLLYPTAAASELFVIDMLCAILLAIDLIHTVVPECSITGGGYIGDDNNYGGGCHGMNRWIFPRLP
jgi:hypothetical protein